jgi:hypothetical protein
MSHEPRPDGRIVELANFGSRFEADVALAELEQNGIQAHSKYGDAGGWMPHVALLDGFRVFVFEEDLDAARALLQLEDRLAEEGTPAELTDEELEAEALAAGDAPPGPDPV